MNRPLAAERRLRRLYAVAAQRRTAQLFDELRDAGIELLWHPGLSLETGAEALAISSEACAEGRELALDILCIEGRCCAARTAPAASICWPAAAGR
jgi:hypothetical protein